MAHVMLGVGNLGIGQHKSAPVASPMFFGELHPEVTLKSRSQTVAHATDRVQQARGRHSAENCSRHDAQAHFEKKEVKTSVVDNERTMFQTGPDFGRRLAV